MSAFLLYGKGNARINAATWFILALGDGLDFASYFDMTDQDVTKNVVPISFAAGSILTFLFALKKGRFAWPDGTDLSIILADFLITIAWLQFTGVTSTVANLAYQATTIVAFIPMYRGLAMGLERETPLPWALWTFAFVVFLLSHWMSGGPWEEGVYPAVGLATHALVLGFALNARRAKA